jgi:mannose-6-phosphate isomerase-like protein (cupin superfamily)
VFHRSVEEIWHVVAGRGQVWRCAPGDRAEPTDVGPGDTLVIPTGWRFQFRALPEGELRFLCYTSPPWPGDDEAVPAEAGGLGEPSIEVGRGTRPPAPGDRDANRPVV